MATSGLMTSVDGALAVAHVITTHAVDGDIDWFTAVDDLVADAGEVGAGHLNTQEFSAGVFYRYASLNIQQLQEAQTASAHWKSPSTCCISWPQSCPRQNSKPSRVTTWRILPW
ncbi:MAG: type I-E CRISPR-associated protein Cas7/Cse4/CasC [Gammaproteobacteria bacterium]